MRLANRLSFKNLSPFLAFILLPCGLARGQDLNVIGVTLLRAMTTNLDGTGIWLAQPEADVATSPPAFEVNPTNVDQLSSHFAYYSSSGSSSTYPNSLGADSWHSDQVGNNLYGIPGGVATNATHVDNFDANYFIDSIVGVGSPFPSSTNDPIVNQSYIAFVATNSMVIQQQQYDSAFDNYANQYGTLFVSGAGFGNTPVSPPSTCYNGISVGVSDGAICYGPTLDNGRSKPDIIAPGGGATSFSTPFVAGTAAVLMQAGLRGDGGIDTNSSTDMRTIKALLLNGAVKPAAWTNSASAPLDTRSGSGMLNAYNSYQQLAGGKHLYIVSTSVTNGSAHPPTGATGTVNSLNAWDFNSVSSTLGSILTPAMDGINHYYFNVTNGSAKAIFTATATLVWNRQAHQSSINNLALFLYNTANSNLVMVSTSMVDNVQHIFVPHLAPGRYDLQVWKAGGSAIISSSETYALAWAFTAPTLTVAKSGGNVILSWPAYPAGFEVVATPNLATTPWSTSGLPSASFVNGTNTITVPATSSAQFFRLYEPNF